MLSRRLLKGPMRAVLRNLLSSDWPVLRTNHAPCVPKPWNSTANLCRQALELRSPFHRLVFYVLLVTCVIL